jgi:subtilisin family serine protease
MSRRRAAFGALSAVVATVVVTLSAGGGVAAEGNTNLRAAEVHSKLLDQLQANPTGGVTAIVTAWGRGGLEEIKQAGVDGLTLKTLPMVITASLTSAQLEKLTASDAVRSVWPEEKFQTHMEDTTWITKARYVWAASPSSGPLKGYGVTGRGIELAMIDTGFDGLHEDGDNLIEFCDTTGLAMGTSTGRHVRCTPWDEDFNDAPAGACGTAHGPDPVGPLPPPGGPPPSGGLCANPARGDSQDPDVSHGTHVGGTIVGTGHASGGKAFNHSTIGMAPDAKLRAYSANVGLSLLNTQILASYDDMTFKKERGYSRVIAVNNSWGGGGGSNYNPNDPQQIAFKRAYDAGILSVFSAGNSGPEHNTLGAQCVNPWVVCVAANTKPDQVVAFSSKGRPSQPSDTNRDGVINDADVPPDNHDRLLGQRHNLGVYRPTLTAPGVAINSMKAIGLNIGFPDSARCREDDIFTVQSNMNCYVQAMGTSMSAPHVTGAVGLIGEAFRQERGRVPTPAEITDILERSANTTKLPGWEAEEQGAGRLDVHQAVRLAKRDISLRRPNFGHPTPPYVSGSYGSATNLTGCTGSLSWSAQNTPSPGDLVPGPVVPQPVPTARYGQHFITVPPNTERLRITVRWPAHPTANLYGLIWRPGVNPDNVSQTPDAGAPPNHPGRPSAYFQTRAFADQEATGIPTGPPPTYRLVEVRAPEETDVTNPAEGGDPPTIPSGKWVLRVYHRAGGAGDACSLTSQETPKQAEGFDYTLRIEMPKATYRPSAKITSPLTGTQSQRFVPIEGRAGYPPHTQQTAGVEETTAPPLGHVGYSWEGITNWEVPGTSTGSDTGEGEPPPGEDTRTVLFLHGNKHATSEPGEAGPDCTGKGETDVLVAGCGPYLLPDALSPAALGANYGPVNALEDDPNDRSSIDPNWVWCLAEDPDGCPGVVTSRPTPPVTVEGPMTVEWWAQTAPAGQTPGAFTMGWTIRLWADDVLRFQSNRIEATPAAPGVPSRLEAVVTLPRITANRKFVLHIDANELDVDQEATFVYYDSQNPCTPTAPVGSECDSLVRMPVVTNGGGGTPQPAPAMPQNVRVTDLPANPAASHTYPQNQPLSPALRVAWDSQNPAPTRYEVYRSTDPAFTNGGSRVFNGAGSACTSPQSPNGQNDPDGHDRSGLCHTDTNVSFGTVYYYRVVAVVRQNNRDTRSTASEIAYGMPTRFDRQVRLKVDRLYGPQVWEHALVPPSPTPSNTTNSGVQWEHLWDTLELTGAHRVFARSFTQGIGSAKDGKTAELDDEGGGGGPGPGPGCPDDDDGDGDDDGDDGDSDDDGDDGDDDCEDDDDDEEDDDD